MSIRFVRLRENHVEKVLQWRTQPEVTRYMYTDIEHDLQKQYEWFERVKHSNTDKYWVIQWKEEWVGLISLHQIDSVNRKASWAYYIGEANARIYGGMILIYFYNYVFRHLGLNKLVAEVMEGNSILKIHLSHGYREVGIYRQHVWKYGQFHDVHLLELLHSDWNLEKYAKYEADFEE